MFSSLKLRTKFSVVFSFVLLSLIIANVGGYLNIAQVNKSFEDFITVDTPRFLILTHMRDIALQIEHATTELFHGGADSSRIIDGQNDILSLSVDMDALLSDYLVLFERESETERDTAELSRLKEELILAVVDAGRFASADEDESALQVKEEDILARVEALTTHVDTLVRYQQQLQQQEKTEAFEAAQYSTYLRFGELASIVVLLLLAELYIVRSLLQPIGDLRDAAIEIAKGNLDKTVVVKGRDEIGELGTAFNTMTTRVKESQGKLEEKAKEIQVALEKVSAFAASSDHERILYQLMLSSIGDAVIVTDNDRKVTIVNHMTEKLLSTTASDMIGKQVETLVKFMKKDSTEPDASVWTRAAGGTEPVSLQIDINVLDAKNVLIPVTALVSPIVDKQGQHTGLIVTIRDIREQRQLEETRISFISVASHQLRTPLTSMRWFSEMLLGGDAGAINDEQKHFVERIYQGTDRMINLVSLLLQIARVEARRLKVEPKPTDLKQMTKGIELSLKTSFDAKKQTVLVSSEPENFPQVMLDQDIVWQVIQNLLSNANRYSPEKATINVKIVEKGEWVEYSVIDKGIGIPDAEKAKIFEKFYRAENALRYVPEGSGLGLSLVKSIVEGWGGKITFDSKEGLGTTFTFTIPRKGMEKREGDVSIAI